MVIKTAFPFSKSKIQCFRQWFCYLTLTNYVTDLSVPFHWKFCFFSTIPFWPLVTWFRCDFFIMFVDDFWNIVHANIADFEYIAVKSFVKFLAFWKMFCYQLKECLCNVCWNYVMFCFRVFDFSDLLVFFIFYLIITPLL